MEDFIKDFLEYMIAHFKKTEFDVDTIKYVLITKFNKRSLMYSSIAKIWLRNFFDLIRRLGYGLYDVDNMCLRLNVSNEQIQIWIEKYIKKWIYGSVSNSCKMPSLWAWTKHAITKVSQVHFL